MVNCIRTNASDLDFIGLVKMLDADLAIRDGDDHPFYAQYNTLASIKHVILAYKDGQAVGCGAFKEFSPGIMEVKRMFTLPAFRGMGIASLLLSELENWARELDYERCILETGIKQSEAIALYKKRGYAVVENYGQYAGVKNSVCFAKDLT
jgi:GNAT superfamily N-acetyltransferase